MSTRESAPRTVLGVYLTPQTIEAVVLRSSDTGERVLHRMVRPRLRLGETARSDDFSSVLPGMKSSEEVDFTLEVGDGDDNLTLDDPALQSMRGSTTPAEGPKLFAAQLRDILSECRSRGYGTPDLAFCVDTPDVVTVELTLRDEASEQKGDALGGVWKRAAALTSGIDREKQVLLDVLRTTYDGAFDPKRVAFVPMTPDGDESRVLALVPTPEEAVSPTLRTLASTDETLELAGRLLDTEASVLGHAAATHVAPAPEQTTAVVRVGTDDTLLLFLAGTELHHVERLRSLTSFDPAETISSRVLLHQDERKIGTVDHVVLVGGPRDERLAERFGAVYPDADVHLLHERMQEGETKRASDVRLTPDAAVALAVAQRLIHDPGVNLFGTVARTRRRRPSMFAWHTVAALLLLCATALFFGWRYMEQQQNISNVQHRLSMSPVEMPELTPEALKQRVDSLNAVHARYNRALYVLDSLLVGSDEWSRAIERTARQTEAIDGVWFDNWSIDASTIKIQGHALKRNNLAEMARNLSGTIQELKFTDIQGARAYPFTITVQRNIAMPEVTTRLREDALNPSLQMVAQDATTASPESD